MTNRKPLGKLSPKPAENCDAEISALKVSDWLRRCYRIVILRFREMFSGNSAHSRTEAYGFWGNLLRALLGVTAIGIAANEIRGAAMAVPVLIALYQSGGTPMAIWIAFCSLAGIALSVVVPVWIYRKVK